MAAATKNILLSWGANSYGQLSQGHIEDVVCPTRVQSSKEGVQVIAGGGGHTILIDDCGKVFSCGWNKKGQLGLGDNVNRHELSQIPDLKTVKYIVCGWNHTMVITDDKSLFVFGCNEYGQLGLGTSIGSYPSPTRCQTVGHPVLHVGAGLRHSVALLEDGTVWTWGDNRKGQLGIPGLQEKKILKPINVSYLTERCSQVAAGSHHTAILTEGGQVYCWGSNQHGQCGLPSSQHRHLEEPRLIGGDLSNRIVSSIVSGWSHLLAVIEGNEVYSWGRSDYGQLGLGDDIVLKKYTCKPTKIPDLRHIKRIVCGSEHNIVLLENGDVMTWGWNEHGICGTGDEVNVYQPRLVTIPEGSHAVQVGCGGGHTFISLQQ